MGECRCRLKVGLGAPGTGQIQSSLHAVRCGRTLQPHEPFAQLAVELRGLGGVARCQLHCGQVAQAPQASGIVGTYMLLLPVEQLPPEG